MRYLPFLFILSCGVPHDDYARDSGVLVDGQSGPVVLVDRDADAGQSPLSVFPSGVVLTVTLGQPKPTQPFKALLEGQEVEAVWSVDDETIGKFTGSAFMPTGRVAGPVTVTATYGRDGASVALSVKIVAESFGDVSISDRAILNRPAEWDTGLAWLYPYDQTVWPRGLAAPLVQWESGGLGEYTTAKVQISEDDYDYTGYSSVSNSRYLIPQDVWDMATSSNHGGWMTVTLTFSVNGFTVGPISEEWKIADGSLHGTVYYNSYGTALAKNYCCTVGGAQFGGAILGVRGGDTVPFLVAGGDGQCRACHSVSANGNTLVAQTQDQQATAEYTLASSGSELTMPYDDGRFAWGALSPDGLLIFSNAGPLQSGRSDIPSALYSVPSGGQLAAVGIPDGLKAAMPVFSPDGKHLAYNFWSFDGRSLAVMDSDLSALLFKDQRIVSPNGIWPSFLPTNDALVYQVETEWSGRGFGETRASCDGCNTGAHGELWTVSLAGSAPVRLDEANGHGDDATLNYQPTVNPVISGGYAWVVFTSRRMYGNVATINPFWSDPRYQDISETPTTKKLWVAAVDLNAPPGVDPSHPAFYLPGQELLSGNSRGYWVVDPCHANGVMCSGGDECCGGYCRGGICASSTPTCSQEFERCVSDGSCCDVVSAMACINGRCGRRTPK